MVQKILPPNDGRNRVSPNLRSANRPLLGGRAISHLAVRIGVDSSDDRTDTVGGNVASSNGDNAIEFLQHHIDGGHPNCYSASQHGRVISACLLRSPASSDCAFIHVGCSVSSLYTIEWLGVVCADSITENAEISNY